MNFLTRVNTSNHLVLLERSDLQQQLSDYQAFHRWAGLLPKDVLMHLKPYRRLESLKAVREMSAEALAQRVQSEAKKHYSGAVYRKALKMAIQHRRRS